MDQELTAILKTMAEEFCQSPCINIEKIPQSGSSRRYFRLFFAEKPSLIGVFNRDVKENEAFFSFTRFFTQQHIPVPTLLAVNENKMYYLLNDLGDETLFSFLTKNRDGEALTSSVIDTYKKVIAQLPNLQLSGRRGIDFSVCYPRAAFDRQSMQWDLNYFKYYFLKLAGIHFDEQLLEDDFNTFIDYLLQTAGDFFLFRDFQSRNIMLSDAGVFFIDYQGGRRGALQYDIASLLYDGKADLPQPVREELLNFYLDELEKQLPIERTDFVQRYYAFVLIRIMQALGAYGFRGYYEKKTHFLLSIPYAVKNIRFLLQTVTLPIEIPHLWGVLKQIAQSDFGEAFHPTEKLTVRVSSFSYKRGLPVDKSGNGGGFVFDCRALPNPGREAQYRNFNGKDKCVIDYLERYPEVARFKEHAFALVDAAVDNYLERRFNSLMVNFGCTGGQHRSVYCAETMANHLRARYGNSIEIVVRNE